MKLKIDKESDALYFRLDDDEVVESEEVQPGIILDFDENGRVIGIEILSLSTRFSPEKLRIMQFETASAQPNKQTKKRDTRTRNSKIK